MTFTVLTLAQLAHVLAIRSERESLFTQGLWSNRPLLGAVLLTFCLQIATLYVPALNAAFKTQPLTVLELLACLGIAAIVFVAVEAEKWTLRRASTHKPDVTRRLIDRVRVGLAAPGSFSRPSVH